MIDHPAARRRAKVIRAIARLNIGGPARHAVILEDGLHERGFDSVLVYGTPARGEGSFESLVVGRGIRAVRIPELGRRIHPWGDALAFWRVLRVVFRERPDIIHTHTAKAGALGRVAGIVFNLTRRRGERCLLVHTFHGHVMSGYFGKFGSGATRLIERTLARWTDRIVTISDRQRRDIVETFRIARPDRVTVIPLGLELDDLLGTSAPDRSLRHALGWTADQFVVGYVGRLVPIKDLHTMLDGFARFAKRDPGARLLLVGDGELRQSLEQQSRSLGIETAVHFAGWRHDLVCVYGAMDVVALTSLNEGTPVAAIEALAASVPVIATSVGGVPDVVRALDTGMLIPPGDPSALADALERLAANRELRQQMGRRGREDVRKRYGRERLVGDIASLYDGLLRDRDGDPGASTSR